MLTTMENTVALEKERGIAGDIWRHLIEVRVSMLMNIPMGYVGKRSYPELGQLVQCPCSIIFIHQ